jgi:hypothetical protein
MPSRLSFPGSAALRSTNNCASKPLAESTENGCAMRKRCPSASTAPGPTTRPGAASIPAQFRRGGASDEWFVLEDPSGQYYDEILGLQLPENQIVMIA